MRVRLPPAPLPPRRASRKLTGKKRNRTPERGFHGLLPDFSGCGLPERVADAPCGRREVSAGKRVFQMDGFRWTDAGSNPVEAMPLWLIGKSTRMVGGNERVRFPSAALFSLSPW